jgi:hypothetical protein
MITRPLLRYHGSKWLLAPWIISYMPRHGVYVVMESNKRKEMLFMDKQSLGVGV